MKKVIILVMVIILSVATLYFVNQNRQLQRDDLNHDGVTDVKDLSLFLSRYSRYKD